MARYVLLGAAALCALAGAIIVAKNPDRVAIALVFFGPAVIFGALGLRRNPAKSP